MTVKVLSNVEKYLSYFSKEYYIINKNLCVEKLCLKDVYYVKEYDQTNLYSFPKTSIGLDFGWFNSFLYEQNCIQRRESHLFKNITHEIMFYVNKFYCNDKNILLEIVREYNASNKYNYRNPIRFINFNQDYRII